MLHHNIDISMYVYMYMCMYPVFVIFLLLFSHYLYYEHVHCSVHNVHV